MSIIANSAAAQHRAIGKRLKPERLSLYKSANMFNEHFEKYFCASRPHLAYQHAPMMGPSSKE